jgi:hypothetical protein
VTSFEVPGGGKMGLYQPKHPLAHGKKAPKKKVVKKKAKPTKAKRAKKRAKARRR